MKLIQNHTAPPFCLGARTSGAATVARTGLAVLTLLTAFALPDSAGAQLALEATPGELRIWTAASAPERLELTAGRRVFTAVAAEEGFIVAGEDAETGDLFFLSRSEGATTELPTPASRTDGLRTGPALLTDVGRLEGTVWLEGTNPQDFSVMASAWNGTSWERVETVSPQRSGPQLAVSAAVLDDGSWLVAWAGFDGADDDIFWSRRVDGAWSKPRRIHTDNDIPDVLPTLTAIPGGAYAAWSFYDGNDYRIRTARWNGAGWARSGILPARGPGRPVFESAGDRSFLTFPSVAPEGWNLVEFESAGPVQMDIFPESSRDRPLLVVGEGSGAALSWPWRNSSRIQRERQP